MESCCPANTISSTVRKSLLDELTLGQELTNTLRVMLCKTQKDKRCKSQLSVQSLTDKILDLFDKSLSILNCKESNEVSDVPAIDWSHSDGQKSEDSGKHTITNATSVSLKSSKRRRTSETTRETVAASFEDGHAWRKYGQKVINNNAEHPRSYFRCTYKNDQGCKARKLVQKVEDEPRLYKITYHDQHTCKKNLFEESHVITDNTVKDSSIIWSFESHQLNYKPNEMVTSALMPIIQQETKEIFQNLHQNKSSSDSSQSDNFISSDLMTFESFGQFSTDFSSAFDQGHLICPDMDTETMVEVEPIFNYFLELW